MKIALALTLSLLTIALPGRVLARTHSSHSFSATVVDDLGTTVHLTHRPTRILSLDPRDTETLFALGAEKRLVGDGSGTHEGAPSATARPKPFRYPSQWPSIWGRDYPIKARELPHVEGGCCGTPWNLETIESLRPDLIISLNSDTPSLLKMRSLGRKVLVLDPANFQGILHDIAVVGKATGESGHARVLVAHMKAQVAAIRKALRRASSRPATFYELGTDGPAQIFTAGKGTYIDQAIRLAGGSNVADGAGACSGKSCYPELNLETLVTLNPQVILLADAAYGTKPADVRARSGWATISAVRSGKIYPFDDNLISRAGPRIVIGIRKIAELLHPQAFGRRRGVVSRG